MPTKLNDYSNTIFYKIYCKDANVTDLYVGHTINFVQRKLSHKTSCKNQSASNHHCKLYNTIRSLGGWENWNMDIIAFHCCNDQYEARKKEQEYFISLNATLNSIEPMPSPKEKPVKPLKINDTNQSCIKEYTHFECIQCNFKCSKQSNYNMHLTTGKHVRIMNNNDKMPTVHQCMCGKTYKYKSGLCKHKHNCNGVTNDKITDADDIEQQSDPYRPSSQSVDMSIVLEVLKQNNEFKQLVIEQTKQLFEQQQQQQLQNAQLLEAVKDGKLGQKCRP